MQRFAFFAIVLVSALAGTMLLDSAFAGPFDGMKGANPAPIVTLAQEGPGGFINPQRDCQTIRTCNFRRGGSYRGCLSSYSCRVCRFVQASCRGLGRRGSCQKLRCSWGGVS